MPLETYIHTEIFKAQIVRQVAKPFLHELIIIILVCGSFGFHLVQGVFMSFHIGAPQFVRHTFRFFGEMDVWACHENLFPECFLIAQFFAKE